MGRMRSRRRTAVPFVALAGVLSALAAGCAPVGDPLSDSDRRAIAQLAEIAPRDAKIDGDVSGVECWKPSESMLDDEQFRVICRVHYDQAGEDRYRDVICIGDLAADPVTDYCYLWAYYTDMPRFEDRPGHAV